MSKTSTTSVNTGNENEVEQIPRRAYRKTLHISKPLGHVNIPALICGGVASLIAIVLDLMHRYDDMMVSMQQTYQEKPFFLESIETWHRSWDWVLAIILATVTAYVVLDSAGKGKRIFFGLASVVLIMMFSPLLMLWGMFWFPIVVIVAVIFAWVFSYIYSTLHVMPCELGLKMKLVKKKKKKLGRFKRHKNKTTPFKKSKLVKKLEQFDSDTETVKPPSFQPTEKKLNTDA